MTSIAKTNSIGQQKRPRQTERDRPPHMSTHPVTTLTPTHPTTTTTNTTTPILPHNGSDIRDCRVLEFLPWSNPENLLPYPTLLLVYRVLGGGLTPWTSFFGVGVNALNCAVFFKQGLQERINLLLFLLACSDIVVSAFLFVSTIEYFTSQVEGQFQINGPLVVLVTNHGSFIYGFVYVSGLISTLIALERCICITYPLVARRVMKTQTMAVGVFVASVFLIVAIHFASAQKYQIICAYHPVLNIRLAVHYPSDFYLQNKQLMDILNTLLNGISLPTFFALTTTISTIITAVKLKTAARWRQTTSSVTMETKEVALTRMLIVVSCLFIGCTVPNIILRIFPMVDTEFRLGGRHQNALLVGVNVLYTANAANSALNFVFYWKMGSRFRAVLKDIICPGRGHTKGLPSAASKTVDTTAG
ncbi:hypothetical protein ACOMHN_047832 [Nucella lapillus]